MLLRKVKIQLAILSAIALLAVLVTLIHFARLPSELFGIDRYSVKLELPQSGGLYSRASVTYRGTEVGRVQSVQLTYTGVEAVLSLQSGFHIPSDLKAEVRSRTAVGEQYVELLPRNDNSPPLRNGDIIPLIDTSIPPDISALIAATNTALQAIPHDNLKTVIDESYTAVGGLGPELSRLVKGSSDLAIEARKNLDPLVTLIDQSKAVLDSQTHTSDAIEAWAAHLATVTAELQTNDKSVASLIDTGGPALGQARQLVERLQPTLPILLANLVSVGQVGQDYHAGIEQALVALPQIIANHQAAIVATANTKQDYQAFSLHTFLNLNLPPSCTTGYLPAQQQRSPTFEDSPDLPPGDTYCRVPQDAQIDVRGVRNFPCETKPGKRAPTVKMCESNEQYVPLNDGYNWKGDPNATQSGQDIPQLPPSTASPPGPSAIAGRDPTAELMQPNLAQPEPKEKTWQSMLIPPGN